MPASISDPAQFELLTQSIACDMQTLSFHWKLYNDLLSAVDEYKAEPNQSHAFWTLTFDGHRDASLFRLCRLYDQHSSSWNLRNWLSLLRDNQKSFDASEPPSLTTLATDIESVSAGDPTVNGIVRLRNNSIAHVAMKPILATNVRERKWDVSFSDVHALIERARQIVNRYTSLLNRQSYSTTIVGHDDYRTVLESVRKSLTKLRTGAREQRIGRLGNGPSWGRKRDRFAY